LTGVTRIPLMRLVPSVLPFRRPGIQTLQSVSHHDPRSAASAARAGPGTARADHRHRPCWSPRRYPPRLFVVTIAQAGYRRGFALPHSRHTHRLRATRSRSPDPDRTPSASGPGSILLGQRGRWAVGTSRHDDAEVEIRVRTDTAAIFQYSGRRARCTLIVCARRLRRRRRQPAETYL